jgi:hypothetical protein
MINNDGLVIYDVINNKALAIRRPDVKIENSEVFCDR